MLLPIGKDIWLGDGPEIVAAMGFHYPTRMVVVRLRDGGVWIWSPIALSDETLRAVQSIGPIRHLVAPNSLHHMSLPEWISACPTAKAHAAPGLAAKRPDIRFDSELGDVPHPDWDGLMDQVVIQGNRITTEVAFFHRPSGTVLITDLIQQLPEGWFKGWRSWVARADLMTASRPSVPRKFRLAFANRQLARQAVDRVLSWPCRQLVCAHAPLVTSGGQEVLRQAFAFLKP